MDDKQLKVVVGGLLHDVGKVLYRASDGRNHSISGYDFLKEEIGLEDGDILDQVRYHHAAQLKNARLDRDSLAYITYIADNIAAASDRRSKGDEAGGFEKDMALESIFNILNGNQGAFSYEAKTLDQTEGINFPSEQNKTFDSAFYNKVRLNLKDVLSQLSYEAGYVNSLLETLEGNLTFVPSSTSKKELADISLYDHLKLTAALGSCIYEYVKENGITDYHEALYSRQKEFYEEKAFLLFSVDISGIQSFIYGQYGNEDVLKNLRARSFYLEIMLENLLDDLLDELHLSRANIIYTGGGHAYLILANTESTTKILKDYEAKINGWMRKQFKTDLFLAAAWTECSAYELENKKPGSYRELFRNLSRDLSYKKTHRYTADEIIQLNGMKSDNHERECRICHRSDQLTEDNLCKVCNGLIKLSKPILTSTFFSVHDKATDHTCIEVGPDRFLAAVPKELLVGIMKEDPSYIRCYSKNRMYAGQALSTKLWVGDYCAANTLGQLSQAGTGINRLGVLRADIDNLGQAFVSGFPEEYQTLSRSATFSRKLSIFFKFHINQILRHGKTTIDGYEPVRNAAIIYSGGDDVFIVGAWKDILEFAIDLHNSLKEYSQNTLTLSAGFGLFPEKYPISYMAEQTGDLENHSKHLEGKNAVTLFDENNRYRWDVFIEKVLGEKFSLIHEFFWVSQERGKNFLYNLLDLMRNRDDRINLARFAYLLARMEPDKDSSELQQEVYKKFSRKMYEWMLDENACKEAVTAIYIYAYLIRSKEGDEK